MREREESRQRKTELKILNVVGLAGIDKGIGTREAKERKLQSRNNLFFEKMEHRIKVYMDR